MYRMLFYFVLVWIVAGEGWLAAQQASPYHRQQDGVYA